MKRKINLLLVLGLALVTIIGCTTNEKKANETEKTQTAISSENKQSDGTRTFLDSAGREVIIPTQINKIAPSGPLAQIVLYTSSPDLLVGLASPFSSEAKEFIDKKYQKLPEFGQFYGKNASLNMEALSAAEPDVIIDIGEAKKTVKEDMNKLQEQINIPTLFIEANLKNMPETYQKLGELLGNTQTTEKLASYCQQVIEKADSVRSSLKESEQKSIYYAAGNAGLNTNAEGSFHAQVIDEIGAKNAATGVDVVSKGGGTVISMEQLVQWQPDYILAETKAVYDQIKTDESWQELTAVKAGKVYQVPTAPYNFISSPPSVNRIIGIQWLGALVYPEQYKLNMEETVKAFYKLFYHVEPTAEQVKMILTNAQ